MKDNFTEFQKIKLNINIENAGISVSGNKENPGHYEQQVEEWLPDKIIKQRALSDFIGCRINYLV